jgi:S-adenosylmethionine decarboxylase
MTVSTGRFGLHLMFDGYDADPARLADADALARLLQDAPARLGMHAIAPAVVVSVGPMNAKDPGGVSGFVLIAESHISFHTFPARRFVTADVYTCRDEIDRPAVEALLAAAFGARRFDTFVQDRGLSYPLEDVA